MKKVIDIPEDINNAITQMGLLRIPDEMIRVVDKAIQHGTPLPKGYGDLIDKYKLAHKMIIEDVSRFKEEPEALAGLFLRMCNKEQAIIEADTQDNCD